MKIVLSLLAVAAIVFIAVIMARPGSQRVPTPLPTSIPVTTQEVDDEAMAISEIKVINMTGDNFRFDPDEIRVKEGDKVRVVLTSVDMPHDFNVDELLVDGSIGQAGETTQVEFTATKIGEFEFYCSVGQHRVNGMVGTLIVE